MIFLTQELVLKLNNYANPNTKIARMVQDGSLIKIKKGIYEDNKSTNPFYLTNVIYGPSYISFQTALGYYGMIPERVYNITCATALKHKSKIYTNEFGTYIYKDVPVDVYPYGIEQIIDGEYSYYIASKEKALCDMLYEYSPVSNVVELKELLFDDLRIDEDAFYSLNMKNLNEIASLYHSKNHKLLVSFIRGKIDAK